MADSDATEWAVDPGVSNEEPADLSELDYDYSSVHDKIEAGMREKEKGNALFIKGDYEAAWKQYDRCFVHIYTSKEEWEIIGRAGRGSINQFKLPCHLNRGLCRLRSHDLSNALWDFTEALRIDPNNVKGLYRRGVVLCRLLKADFAKEERGELWDLEGAEKKAEEAKVDLMRAVKIAPNDVGIRQALEELKGAREELKVHRKKYRQDQKKLYSRLVSNMDKENQKLSEAEESGLFQDMPRLERIRIS